MGEFFRGRRRKTGVLTLVLASASMVGWLRSDIVEDDFRFWVGSYCVRFDSYRGTIYWSAKDILHFWPEIFCLQQLPKSMERDSPLFQNPITSNHSSRVISDPRGVSKLQVESSFNDSLWVIPYWSIVLPLTVLLAYLLLSKPRKASPKKITEPIASERA